MKYRHGFHAGNFADVHKHVTLVALLHALRRKEKGFLYVDTHGGAGYYRLDDAPPGAAREWQGGVGRFDGLEAVSGITEIADWLEICLALRRTGGEARGYPGSPLIGARLLRPQDRGVAIEHAISEAEALRRALPAHSRMRIECGDGFARLRALLPPPERRGLVLLDPPYEETAADFARTAAALTDALRRFATCTAMVWYPIKLQRDAAAWQMRLEACTERPLLHSELRLYPADSRASLNGSGITVINPPHRFAERMHVWLPALHERLAVDAGGGCSVREPTNLSGNPVAPV